jgi:hypothetical protein
MPRLVLLAPLLLSAAAGCEPPPPKQAHGEVCNMEVSEWDRCAPGFYCREQGFMWRLTHAAGKAVGKCAKRIAEGERCVNVEADCETWLVCESQSGVCRPRAGLRGGNMRNDTVNE